MMAGLQARGWFEYVESDANWSDGASRMMLDDPWILKEGFLVHEAQVPLWPWMAEPSQRCAEILRLCENMGATVGSESIGGLCTVVSAPASPPLDIEHSQ